MTWQNVRSSLEELAIGAIISFPAVAAGVSVGSKTRDYFQYLYHNPVIAFAGGLAVSVATGIGVAGLIYSAMRGIRSRLQAGGSR